MGLDVEPSPSKKKAKKPATSTSPAKAAPGGNSGALTSDDLRQHVTDGTLAKLTVPVLKQGLAALGLKAASARKADLVAAITDHFA